MNDKTTNLFFRCFIIGGLLFGLTVAVFVDVLCHDMHAEHLLRVKGAEQKIDGENKLSARVGKLEAYSNDNHRWAKAVDDKLANAIDAQKQNAQVIGDASVTAKDANKHLAGIETRLRTYEQITEERSLDLGNLARTVDALTKRVEAMEQRGHK